MASLVGRAKTVVQLRPRNAESTRFKPRSADLLARTAFSSEGAQGVAAAVTKSETSEGHSLGKSKRATLAVNRANVAATRRDGSESTRVGNRCLRACLSWTGTRAHSLLERVLRGESPTAFLATTAARRRRGF